MGKDGSVVWKPLQKLTLYNVNMKFLNVILDPTLFCRTTFRGVSSAARAYSGRVEEADGYVPIAERTGCSSVLEVMSSNKLNIKETSKAVAVILK